jgi:protein arginine kinase
MNMDSLLTILGTRWIKENGPYGDIVLTSRVRLARNMADVPFPPRASAPQLLEVINASRKVFKGLQEQKKGGWGFCTFEGSDALQRQALVEKHLISPEHAKEKEGRGLIVNGDETISVMINEEDHFRIQCLLPGFQLEQALQEANEIDNIFEEHLNIAFDESRGFLTCCPTNVGTGMRASVMLHLPALAATKQLGNVMNAIGKLGLTARGMYGEGTEGIGNIFQISNQITLGFSEEDIIDSLSNITMQIIEQEKIARDAMLKNNHLEISDRIWRSYGVLRYVRQISFQEAMQLLSDIFLGKGMGIIRILPETLLKELMVGISPAFIQIGEGKSLSPGMRDVKRAGYIRRKLQSVDNTNGGEEHV